ncbi:cation:proton antiporter [Belnapia sp. T18]|uniref:Cation:proton antiporter n=1 Tax=Belnapia arida TaxID=2804533 RepID=A0ABS1UCN1_9PROT|nr:cation:proton antiporter [Belnapia arida]MBL6082443.1 cation:proton antiporter [Belnapia arida]
MIVPLLAVVAFLSPLSQGKAGWTSILVAVAALLALLAVSRWGLNPFFALLARARTRKVLTAGALLVVLGAALLMDVAGLSMAMGAFLAGVMLSSSSYRHQIEGDIEPFRGLLMGLFFLAVGMSLDLAVIAAESRFLLIIWSLSRSQRASWFMRWLGCLAAPTTKHYTGLPCSCRATSSPLCSTLQRHRAA